MKRFGIVLAMAGVVGLICSFMMKTTVTTDYGQEVVNLSLIDTRHVLLGLSALVVLVGVIFFGFAMQCEGPFSIEDKSFTIRVGSWFLVATVVGAMALSGFDMVWVVLVAALCMTRLWPSIKDMYNPK